MGVVGEIIVWVVSLIGVGVVAGNIRYRYMQKHKGELVYSFMPISTFSGRSSWLLIPEQVMDEARFAKLKAIEYSKML